MQLNYEHCLPIRQDELNSKRSAIIFRHGNTLSVNYDTGIPLINDAPDVNPIHNGGNVENSGTTSQFGHIGGEIREGKKLYTKNLLKKCGAHR